MAQALLKRRNWLNSRLTEKRENGEEGFTLIELLIVLLIIGILLAIAIPTYLSVVGSASTNTALTNLQTAITAGDAVYVNSGAFPTAKGAFLADLNNQADGITWNSGTAVKVNTNQVSFDVVNSGEVEYAAAGSNSKCYYVDDIKVVPSAGTGTIDAAATTPGTYYGTAAIASGGTCSALGTAVTSTPAWSTQAP